MRSRSSPSGSPTGARHGARPGQRKKGSPRQKGARKRHRGGGGLAVPGPFKRIARAGGQKVTIRTAQRGVFKNSSDTVEDFFRYSRNDPALTSKSAEMQADQRCIDPACGRGASAA